MTSIHHGRWPAQPLARRRRRRDEHWLPPRPFVPSGSARQVDVARGKGTLFAPRRRIDLTLILLVVLSLIGATWFGSWVWNATRVDVAFSGFTDGAVLRPEQAADIVASVRLPTVDQRQRAELAFDGEPVGKGTQIKGSTITWRPPTDIAEGDHTLELRVARTVFGDSTFSWAFSVDGTRPEVKVPPLLEPVDIDEPVTVSGRVEPDARLIVDGDPMDHADGAFTLRYDFPPAAPIHIEAVDPAGNHTNREIIVPVTYPTGMRGVHMTAIAWGNDELRNGVLAMIDEGRINTVELDIKDEAGVVGHESKVPRAIEIGAVQPEYNLRDAVALLEAKGVRVIGRIVAFRDAVLADAAWNEGNRDQVLQNADGTKYAKYDGFTNFAHPEVRQYNIDLATEAVEAGVTDILWDYVRRPEGDITQMVIPGVKAWDDDAAGRAVVEFLRRSRTALRPMKAYQGASVFGVSAAHGDLIAQPPREVAEVVDYIAPMLYPSHWVDGEYGVTSPIRQPYEIVDASLADFQRVTAGTGVAFVPWLQDFTYRGVPYTPDMVKAQIDATRSRGIDNFLLWNASVKYTPEALAPNS
jgi:hypothetical protein